MKTTKTQSNPSPTETEESCTILFGHNAQIHKVLVQFPAPVDRLVLAPEAARDVAQKLQQYADLAEDRMDVEAAKKALKDPRRYGWDDVKAALKK